MRHQTGSLVVPPGINSTFLYCQKCLSSSSSPFFSFHHVAERGRGASSPSFLYFFFFILLRFGSVLSLARLLSPSLSCGLITVCCRFPLNPVSYVKSKLVKVRSWKFGRSPVMIGFPSVGTLAARQHAWPLNWPESCQEDSATDGRAAVSWTTV